MREGVDMPVLFLLVCFFLRLCFNVLFSGHLTHYQTKFLDWSKLKAFQFADDKSNLAEKLEFVFGRVENIVGKGDKRAMMALDRSPESFSPQMKSTSLFLWFQLVTPGWG